MIKSIEIEINGETIKLTLDQAKKLYDELEELFQKTKPYTLQPQPPYWQYPIITYESGTTIPVTWEN